MSNSFFLKSVSIENFKAVRKSGNVELTPLTVFIGNNGSGKSSLIEALETYRGVVLNGLDDAMQRWRGIEYIWNKWASHRQKTTRDGRPTYENPIVFHMRGRRGRGSFNVKMDIVPNIGFNSIRIESETIKLPVGLTTAMPKVVAKSIETARNWIVLLSFLSASLQSHRIGKIPSNAGSFWL
jgi:hypothetical protein